MMNVDLVRWSERRADNLLVRRLGHTDLFNYCVAFFMPCMISLKSVVKYLSLTIRAGVLKII